MVRQEGSVRTSTGQPCSESDRAKTGPLERRVKSKVIRALPEFVCWRQRSIAAGGTEINQRRSEEIEHGRDQRDNPITRGGELGQPVRNT